MKKQAVAFARFFLPKFRDVLVTVLLISFLVFAVFYLIPGDPITMILGTEASAEKRVALEQELGLDRGPLEQYWRSLTGIFNKEEPSLSIRFQRPVRELLAERMGLTALLSGYAFFLIAILAFPLALLCATHENSWLDRGIGLLTQFFMAIPGFFLGIVLTLIFSWLFSSFRMLRFPGFAQGFWPALSSLTLPAIALALPRLAQAIQFLRSAIFESLQEDYVRTAKAKGSSPTRILFGHVLRNSLLPFITSLGLILAELLTGGLIVEQVFVLPGVGRLLITAIEARDLPLSQGIIMSFAILLVLINLTVDILARLIDPRLLDPNGGQDND